MKVFRFTLAAVLLGFFPFYQAGEVYGADLFQFIIQETADMPADDCLLIERYYDEKTKRLSFQGRLDKHGCWVSMSHKEYEERFQFCYLAGVVQHKTMTSQSAECFIQKTAKEYLFRAHVGESMWKDSQMACYFTCIGR